MINESEFRLLSHLVKEREETVGVATLGERLDWSLSHTSRVVAELESTGLISVRETGREKLVALANLEPVEELETLLIEYEHVPFAEVVAGSALVLLYYLDQPRTATELTEMTGLSRATVYRRLDDLQEVGIVGKSRSRFRLNDPFSPLVSIARGVAHHQHKREAEQYTSGVIIVWERHDEYLLACDSEIEASGFHLTGPALLAEFDLQLLTRDRRHYFRSDGLASVSPVDLVCHLLLIDDGPRYRRYCLLLMEACGLDPAALRDRAEQYEPLADIELSATVEELTEYLRTQGAATHPELPSWDEFQSLAAEYEVEI